MHHFARQLASPFPLLAAMAARTSRIEIGTGVVDMRYENPLYMAEEAAATDLISDGRLQLGVSRDHPRRRCAAPGVRLRPAGGHSDADLARDKTALFLAAIAGQTVVDADPRMTGGVAAGWRSSRSRRGCATASGGVRAPGRRRSGRRVRA